MVYHKHQIIGFGYEGLTPCMLVFPGPQNSHANTEHISTLPSIV